MEGRHVGPGVLQRFQELLGKCFVPGRDPVGLAFQHGFFTAQRDRLDGVAHLDGVDHGKIGNGLFRFRPDGSAIEIATASTEQISNGHMTGPPCVKNSIIS